MQPKMILLAVAALLLAGCGSLSIPGMQGQMQNRITVSLDCQRGFMASLYGPVGITSEIYKGDVAMLPCARPAPAASAPASQPVIK